MSVVCWAFFLMLGTVGFRASLMFVRHIYRCGRRSLALASPVSLCNSCLWPTACIPSGHDDPTRSRH
jgi:hypothetical protein